MKNTPQMLKDKVIVVAGGAGFIGKEFLKAVLENGAYAVMSDVNKDSMEKALGDIKGNTREHRDKIISIKMDITSEKSVRSAIDCIRDKYGKIDALVNSAYPKNKNYGRDFLDVEYRDFCENVNLHLGGYFLTSKIFAKYFLKQGYGNIINVASVYGVIQPKFEIYQGSSITMPLEYAAVKSALIHLTKYMAKYLKGKNIRVNAISPGGIFKNQPKKLLEKYKAFCLNKGMLAESDLNGTLIYLLSDMSEYVNGQNIIVTDGFDL